VNQHVDKYKKSEKSVSRVVWACVYSYLVWYKYSC